MTQIGDDRELMAEFAQFKELLRRDLGQGGPAPETLTQTGAPAPGAAPENADVAPQAPVSPPVNEWGAARGWSEQPTLAALDAEPDSGRKRLFYLAAAVVAVGVAGLGWALNPWRAGGEDPALATAPPLIAPEDVAPPASETATAPTAPADESAAPAPADANAPPPAAVSTDAAATAPAAQPAVAPPAPGTA
ncbi:MAG: hypothetical protein N2444_03515, partial [Methylocystis sp.]|nr:hypothetical protein [Methylocystis sp.]